MTGEGHMCANVNVITVEAYVSLVMMMMMCNDLMCT